MQVPTKRRLLRMALAGTLVAGCGSLAVAQRAGPAEIEQLLVKQAITELLYTYPRGLDRGDREILMSIAHPDAKMRFGNRDFPSWAAYVDWLIKAHEGMVGNNHRVTNILIQVNGDRAVSECTGTATLLVPKEGNPDLYEERWMHSRYLDKWSRRNGKWALDARHTVSDYRRVLDVSADLVKSRYQIGGRAHRDDPSYKLFGDK
jgi:hypothetical protein